MTEDLIFEICSKDGGTALDAWYTSLELGIQSRRSDTDTVMCLKYAKQWAEIAEVRFASPSEAGK